MDSAWRECKPGRGRLDWSECGHPRARTNQSFGRLRRMRRREWRTDSAGAGPLSTRRLLGGLGHLVAGACLVAAVVVLAPGFDGVRDRLGGLEGGWLTLAAVVKLLSCVAFVAVFRAVYAPEERVATAVLLGLAVLAVTTLVPLGGAGGLALAAWVLRRRGAPVEQIARRSVAFFALTSLSTSAPSSSSGRRWRWACCQAAGHAGSAWPRRSGPRSWSSSSPRWPQAVA